MFTCIYSRKILNAHYIYIYIYIYTHVCVCVFFPHGSTAPSGPGPPQYRGFTITLRHTTLGKTPLDE